MRQLATAVALIASVAAQPALADFRFAEPASDASGGPATTDVVGEMGDPTPAAAVAAAGAGVPLAKALKEIVPKGWQGYSKDAAMERTVSWQPAADWRHALAQVMRESGNRAVIDWDKKRVTVLKDTRRDAAVTRTVAAPVAVEARPVAPVKVATLAEPGKWRLAGGAAVHEQLTGWARQSGWTLKWKVPVSWVAAADAEFTGDFPAALSEVIELLYAEGKPVRMKLWDGNRVAEIFSSEVK